MSSANYYNRKINPEFAQWACSPSAGFTGGNPFGDIWFCGIEFGGSDVGIDYDISKYDLSNNKFPSWNNEFKEEAIIRGWRDCSTWQFNQKQAKIICNIYNINNWQGYIKNILFTEKCNAFSMNLYPFNFKNTEYNNWTRKYYLKTGFLCKTEYIAWCMQNRFPFLKEVVHKYCPKVLICVGTTLKLEFKMAFLDNIEEIFEGEKYREMNSKQINKKNIEWSFINNNKTLLLITPFLGRGGFMSDKSLEELATFIKQTIKL